jgi:phosphate starvation-inducible PhoH-like protein
MAQTRRLTVGFQDSEGLRTLCGERDSNLRWLETRLGIQVMARGNEVHLQGDDEQVTAAAELLGELFARARTGAPIGPDDMGRLIDAREARADGTIVRPLHVHRPRAALRAGEEVELAEGTRGAAPMTPGQKRYVDAIRSHDVVFGIGPAGSGKTFLAMAAALGAMNRREVKRIVLTRPAVEAGERLGFLPGDLNEKVSPYLRPLYDALRELVDQDRFERMMERGQIEVAPLAFMRGRTLANSFVILDEAQNCTSEQMVMLLTRMGEHTKVVVTGDPSQSDLPYGMPGGLLRAVEVLQEVEGIQVVRLGLEDVVRHPLVGRIIAAFEADRMARLASEPTGPNAQGSYGRTPSRR